MRERKTQGQAGDLCVIPCSLFVFLFSLFSSCQSLQNDAGHVRNENVFW